MSASNFLTTEAKHASNSERYRHIPIAKVIELFEEGHSHRKIGKMLGMGASSVTTRLVREGKKRQRPGLEGEKLSQARLDAAWEARHGVVDRVVCRVCGKFMAAINANGNRSHLRTHKMTAKEYAKTYPGVRLFSVGIAHKQAARQGRKHDLQKFMEQLAAEYVTAAELVECRRDHEWEELRVLDFVTCRDCGLKLKGDLWVHLRNIHGYRGFPQYREKWRKAPCYPSATISYRKEYAKDRHRRSKDIKNELATIREKLSRAKPVRETRGGEVRDIIDKHLPNFQRIFASVKNIEALRAHARTLQGLAPREVEAARYAIQQKDRKRWAAIASRQYAVLITGLSYDTVAKHDKPYNRALSIDSFPHP